MTEKNIKPKIEEIAANLLEGDKLKNFLDFNEFLKNNKLTATLTAKSSWSVKYKTKRICQFRFDKDFWFMSHFSRANELIENCDKYVTDELKEFILEHINTTTGCHSGKCKGVENGIILGKIFESRCQCHPLVLVNPEGKALQYAKELVLVNKNTAADIAAGKT